MAKISKTIRSPRPTSAKALPRWKPLEWEDYSVGTGWDTNRATLERAVQRASKAANQRLRTLEAHGRTKGAYAWAQQNLGTRTRFRERAKSLSDKELRAEYARLREFISASSSTPTGIMEADQKRFAAAQEAGFSGSMSAWLDAVEEFFTKENERLFGSHVIYQAIAQGRTDIIRDIVQEHQSGAGRGALLKEYLRRVEQGY